MGAPTYPHCPSQTTLEPPLTVRTEQLLLSKAHVRAPHLGKGLGEGETGWGPPRQCRCLCGGHLTSTQLPRTCTGSSSASSPGTEPSGCKAQGQAGSAWLSPLPCPRSPVPPTCVTV